MLITVPNSIVKGQEITLDVDIDELLNTTIISNSSYYSDISNWKQIAVEYSDPEKYQKLIFIIPNANELLANDVVQTSDSVTSNYKSDDLIFRELVVYDRANGFIKVKRNDLIDNFDMEF
jgi:hypothetical protein